MGYSLGSSWSKSERNQFGDGGILFQWSKRERQKGDERSAFLEPLDFVQSRKIIYSLHFAPPPLPYASLKFPFTILERTTDFNSIHAFEVLGYFPASSVVAFMMRSNKKKSKLYDNVKKKRLFNKKNFQTKRQFKKKKEKQLTLNKLRFKITTRFRD